MGDPLLSSIDAFASSWWEIERERRFQAFWNRMLTDREKLIDEVIRSDTFCRRLVAAYQSVQRTIEDEKVLLFADLLKNGTLSDDALKDDEYAELARIVDDLSVREFIALCIVEKWNAYMEDITAGWTHDVPMALQMHGQKLFEELSRQLKVDGAEADAILARLVRTGCYQRGSDIFGRLTAFWFKLRKYVEGPEIEKIDFGRTSMGATRL